MSSIINPQQFPNQMSRRCYHADFARKKGHDPKDRAPTPVQFLRAPAQAESAPVYTRALPDVLHAMAVAFGLSVSQWGASSVFRGVWDKSVSPLEVQVVHNSILASLAGFVHQVLPLGRTCN